MGIHAYNPKKQEDCLKFEVNLGYVISGLPGQPELQREFILGKNEKDRDTDRMRRVYQVHRVPEHDIFRSLGYSLS